MTDAAMNRTEPSLQDEGDDLDDVAVTYLNGFPPDRVRAIVAEARRLRARLSSIPFYAEKEKRRGSELWLRLAISYAGED